MQKKALPQTKLEPPPAGAQGRSEVWGSLFAAVFGGFLGLALLKFGNPPITEKWVTTPTEFYEFVLGCPWPIAWAYGLLVLVVVAGIGVARWKPAVPWWLAILPLVWLAWQFMAGAHSADAALTKATLKHFAACVACFYLGCYVLSGVKRVWPFWLGLVGGFVLVLAVGWDQHFGGLEATRRYFFLYVYPGLKEVSPDYLKKISSNRIFATLFYPNSLAGGLLLLLPVALAAIWQLHALLTAPARGLLMGLVGAASLACLYWSGSKGGWLLMLVVGLVGLLRFPFSRRLKVVLLAGLLLAGLAGFFWKHSVFFRKGATSVSARFDYWQAAAHTVRQKPLFGSGPGTFGVAYQKIKRQESEMTRLVHNDYLEQASDSGVVGGLAYIVFIVSALTLGYPRKGSMAAERGEDWLPFGVWLGVLGWSLQGLVEFGLYIPALAWPAFAFLGWLLGRKPG